jgi:hypothetical protein
VNSKERNWFEARGPPHSRPRLELGKTVYSGEKRCCLDCPSDAKFGIGGTKIGAVTMEQLKRIWEQIAGHKRNAMRNISRTRSSVLSRYKRIARVKDTRYILHNVLHAYTSPSVAYVAHLLAKEIGAARERSLSDGHCCTEKRHTQSR